MDWLFLTCFEPLSQGRIEPRVTEQARWIAGGKGVLRIDSSQVAVGGSNFDRPNRRVLGANTSDCSVRGSSARDYGLELLV